MSDNLLTDEEMTALTGCTQPKKQIRVLQDNNIYHIVRHDNKPVTTWYNVNNPTHLRGITQQVEEPDFSEFIQPH